MSQEIILIDSKEFGLETNEAAQIESVFIPMIEKMSELEKQYNEIIKLPIDKDTIKKARELRLVYVKTRTGTAEIHKTAKQYYLAGGRFVDAWKNAQAFSAQGKEDVLEKIEKHFEIIEEQKKLKVEAERIEQLKEFVADVSVYQLKDMTDVAFQELFTNSKTAYDVKIAAEKKAEEDRIAEETRQKEEQERIKKENEELKKQAELREKQIQEERAIAEAARLKAEAEAKKQAELLADIENKKRLADEAVEREKLEALQAPDKEKIKAFANRLSALEYPVITDKKMQEILNDAKKQIDVAISVLSV